MTIRNMIDAAYNNNAVQFNKSFDSVIREKMADALQDFRADVVADVFNFAEPNSEESPGEGV